MHEAGSQLVVVIEGAPLVHPSPKDAFMDAQTLTPSIDEGVQPKIKTAPRRASPTRFVVDSSGSTPTMYGLQFIQGPMEDLVFPPGPKGSPSRQKGSSSLLVFFLSFQGQHYPALGWGPYFYNPQEKKT